MSARVESLAPPKRSMLFLETRAALDAIRQRAGAATVAEA